MSKAITRHDLLAALLLLLPPLLLFWSVTLGAKTLLPADNLFAYEPWASYRGALGGGPPHNQLLSDLILENYAWKRFIRDSLAAGRLPLWNPYILAGQPFLANGQHSALYPFSVIFYLLPLSKAYGWFTVSQLWLAGLFIYIFVRVLLAGTVPREIEEKNGGIPPEAPLRLGATLRADRFGALVAGLTFSLSLFFVVSVVFTMIIAAAIWLPLVLAMIEIIIRRQGTPGYSPIPYVVLGALALGMQALAGHVEITYYTLLVSGYYAGCRLWWTSRLALRPAGWLLAMVLLGMGLGAAQLAPMYEVVTQNFRSDAVTLEQVQGWALPARRVATFFIPDFFGSPAHHGYFDVVTRQWQPLGPNAHGEVNPLCPGCTSWDTKTAVEAGAYVGILPLVLAALAVGWAAKRRISERASCGSSRSLRDSSALKRTPDQLPESASSRLEQLSLGFKPQATTPIFIFAGLAVLSLLFAFGTPLYALLFYGLPGWNQLHSPFRWLYPFTLSVAVLAGLGAALGPHPNPLPTPDPHPQPLSQGERGDSPPPSPRGRGAGGEGRLLAWLLFFGGVAGLLVTLAALVVPEPFIRGATLIFERSGLAQNAFANGRQFFGYQWPNFFKFFLMVMAAGAVLRVSRCPIFVPRSQGVNAWKPLALLVITLDLMLAGAGFNPAADPTLLNFKPAVVSWLAARQAEDPLFRLSSFDTPDGRGNKVFLANAGMVEGFYDVRGYDSIIPAQYSHFVHLIQENGDLLFNRVGPLYYDGYNALDSALLDLLGVRYILTTVEINNPNYTLVYDGEIRVYENTDALPRAFLVYQQERVPPGPGLDLALRSLNPREKVLLDGVNNGLGHDLTAGQPASPGVEIIAYTPNEILLTARLEQAGWLVLADNYFAGWRAHAQPLPPQPPLPQGEEAQSGLPSPNGGEAGDRREEGLFSAETELTIHRANGTFRAISLPAGAWEVRFRYSPRSVQLGAYGSFLALVTLALLGGYWAWGRLYRESDSDSAIKRIAKNSLVPMVMALANRLVDLAFALLMLRILQPEGAGRFSFAVAFIGLAEIVTRYGLGTLVTREVAGNRAEGGRYLANVSVLRLYLWLAALPLMGVILALYVVFGGMTPDVVVTVAIFALGTLLSNWADGITAIFYAHEKAEYPAGVASVTTLTRVSLGGLVLLLGWGIVGLALASLAANLVAFVALGYMMATKIFRPTFVTDTGLQRGMLRESLPLMLNHLLATIFFRIDLFILAPTWGDRTVGYYSAAYKYVDGINLIPQYFTLAIFPLMSRYAKDSCESLIRAYELSLRLLLMLALPIAAGTPFVAHELIWFLAGERFLPDSAIVLQLLIWFLPFSFINQVTQYLLISINQQRHLTRAFIIGVLFNLIANLIFIPLYGYRAAAITTIISEWALLIPFYLLVRKNLCVIPWWDVVWRPTVSAGGMAGLLWLLGDLNFFVTVAVAGASYSLILTAVGGFRQRDMEVLWRALRLRRYR